MNDMIEDNIEYGSPVNETGAMPEYGELFARRFMEKLPTQDMMAVFEQMIMRVPALGRMLQEIAPELLFGFMKALEHMQMMSNGGSDDEVMQGMMQAKGGMMPPGGADGAMGVPPKVPQSQFPGSPMPGGMPSDDSKLRNMFYTGQ